MEGSGAIREAQIPTNAIKDFDGLQAELAAVRKLPKEEQAEAFQRALNAAHMQGAEGEDVPSVLDQALSIATRPDTQAPTDLEKKANDETAKALVKRVGKVQAQKPAARNLSVQFDSDGGIVGVVTRTTYNTLKPDGAQRMQRNMPNGRPSTSMTYVERPYKPGRKIG